MRRDYGALECANVAGASGITRGTIASTQPLMAAIHTNTAAGRSNVGIWNEIVSLLHEAEPYAPFAELALASAWEMQLIHAKGTMCLGDGELRLTQAAFAGAPDLPADVAESALEMAWRRPKRVDIVEQVRAYRIEQAKEHKERLKSDDESRKPGSAAWPGRPKARYATAKRITLNGGSLARSDGNVWTISLRSGIGAFETSKRLASATVCLAENHAINSCGP